MSAPRTGPIRWACWPARRRTPDSFEPAGTLEFGKTYYWRVDEVNGPPNANVFKGQVWSFTVEPYAYPIKGVTATASSARPAWARRRPSTAPA